MPVLASSGQGEIGCGSPRELALASRADRHLRVGHVHVAWVEEADEVDIDRLVVDPMAHHRGAGRELVRSVLSRAGSRRTTVSTGRRNLPARTLYLSLGFEQMEDTEVETDLWITHFVRVL